MDAKKEPKKNRQRKEYDEEKFEDGVSETEPESSNRNPRPFMRSKSVGAVLDQGVRTRRSLPSYILQGENLVGVSEADLRWRRAGQAVIQSLLPSHQAIHSQSGMMLSRSQKLKRQGSSFKSKTLGLIAAIRMKKALSGDASLVDLSEKKPISEEEQMKVQDEDRFKTLENIKSMIATIAVKRKYRDQIVTEPQKKLRGWARFKHQARVNWLAFKSSAKSLMYELEPWAGAFKIIEGHFGTATMSYFRFLRWLMFLNLYMAIIMMGLTIVPFLVLKPKDDADFSAMVNGCESKFHYVAKYYSSDYSTQAQNETSQESVLESVLDVLLGSGWLTNTELFYGVYHNRTYTLPIFGEHQYNMTLYYLLAVGLAFFLSFILLVKNSAKNMKEGVLNASGGSLTQYCNKVFGAWDFCIIESKTAEIKTKSIFQELNSDLECQRLEWRKAGRTRAVRVKLFLIRCLINVFVICILGGSLYLIYYTNQILIQLLNDEANKNLNEVVVLILQYLPSITITLLNVIVPVLFTKLILAEDYMPAFERRLTLIRTVLLRLASVGMLMLSLYTQLQPGKLRKHSKHTLELPDCVIDLNHTDIANFTDPKNITQSLAEKCWETYVGQQLYKLITLNFLIVVIVTFVWEFPRRIIFKKYKHIKVINLMGQQEFDLNRSVLDLVYLQTLCWLGMFFSPLIPAMCFVKCFVFFYVKKTSLLHNYHPRPHAGASKSNSLFMLVLLLSFVLSSIPIAYMIGRISPSQSCGPYRVYSEEGYVMFDVITNIIELWPTEAQLVLFFLGTGGCMAIAFCLLGLLMYYFWAVGQGHRKMTKLLRDQLKVEGQDKQFLLARLNEALSYKG